jgi:hypothetical protein
MKAVPDAQCPTDAVEAALAFVKIQADFSVGLDNRIFRFLDNPSKIVVRGKIDTHIERDPAFIGPGPKP